MKVLDSPSSQANTSMKCLLPLQNLCRIVKDIHLCHQLLQCSWRLHLKELKAPAGTFLLVQTQSGTQSGLASSAQDVADCWLRPSIQAHPAGTFSAYKPAGGMPPSQGSRSVWSHATTRVWPHSAARSCMLRPSLSRTRGSAPDAWQAQISPDQQNVLERKSD